MSVFLANYEHMKNFIIVFVTNSNFKSYYKVRMDPFINAHNFTDEQLMEEYIKGDHMAFEALYVRYQKTVFSYLRKRLPDEQSQGEVFQNTFLKLHRNRDRYQSKYPFIKWLYTIARSELLDFCKLKKLDTVPFEDDILFYPY